MNDQDERRPKKVRRRQEDRSNDTRRRMIDATIASLYRVGYSAVTFSMVAEEAGISRGIISYHYATKTDLMVAVRDEVHARDREALELVRSGIGTEQFLRTLVQLTAATMHSESAIAVDEILLAARADPELSAKLREKEREIEHRRFARLEQLMLEAGFVVPEALPTIVRIVMATLRGLAMAELVQGEDANTKANVEYLTGLVKQLIPLTPDQE